VTNGLITIHELISPLEWVEHAYAIDEEKMVWVRNMRRGSPREKRERLYSQLKTLQE